MPMVPQDRGRTNRTLLATGLDIRMREYLCRRLSAARRRQKYEPGSSGVVVDEGGHTL